MLTRRGFLAATTAAAHDWPQRLKPLWKVAVGEGHSSPVVSGVRVYQFARRADGNEVVYAFDFAAGKKLWEHAYAAPYEMNPAATGHGKGPKSTPLVANGRVYTLGMTGVLLAVNASTGKPVWRFDSQGKFRATSPLFGVAVSPLLHSSNLIAYVGTDEDGALTAFDAATGQVRWQWKGNGPGYGSPVLAGNQIVAVAAENMVGVQASDGSLAWQLPLKTPYTQNSVTPIAIGDTVIYSGLANPVTAIRIAGKSAQKVWENKEVGMYMNSPVLAAGLLHGLSHRNKGQYFSLDPKTGKTVWTSEGRQTENAAMIARGDEVLSLNTESELQVFRASPRGLEPLKKYTVADSPTWAHPVVVGARVLVKDRDSLALWG
jgi:outer membrane protein assembly factor BamB